MTEGEAEPSAAEICTALLEVALELGGGWTVEISPDGQLSLAQLPDHP